MDQESGAPEVLFSNGTLEPDNRLLDLAVTGDVAASNKLWTRYYTAAFTAASVRASKSAEPNKVIAQGFKQTLNEASRHSMDADAFLEKWFDGLGAKPPATAHRAVVWAFYALPLRNRTIVWRHNADKWSTELLADELGMDPKSASYAIDQANAQFTDNMALAAGLLGIRSDLDLFRDPVWRRTALIAGLLHTSEEILESLGPRITSPKVITPPLPENNSHKAAAAAKPPFGLRVWWSNAPSMVRAIPLAVGAFVIVIGGVVGIVSLHNSSAEPATIPTIPTTKTTTSSEMPTPTPTMSTTQTSTPTVKPTLTPSATPTHTQTQAQTTAPTSTSRPPTTTSTRPTTTTTKPPTTSATPSTTTASPSTTEPTSTPPTSTDTPTDPPTTADTTDTGTPTDGTT